MPESGPGNLGLQARSSQVQFQGVAGQDTEEVALREESDNVLCTAIGHALDIRQKPAFAGAIGIARGLRGTGRALATQLLPPPAGVRRDTTADRVASTIRSISAEVTAK